MKLSPLEVRKQEFNRGMRGYDPDEVRAFLSSVANQMEELMEDHERAEKDLEEHKSKMGHLEDVQEALQATLNTARTNAEETRQTALKKAEMIIHEAHLKAEEIFKKAERQLDKLRTDITELETKRDQILAKIKSVLTAELDMLKSLSPEAVDDQRDSGIEVAALEYIDPKARAYREELLAKAAAAAARDSGDGEEQGTTGQPAEDESHDDGAQSENDGAVGDAQDIAEVVASLKASVGETLDETEVEVDGEADTAVDKPEATTNDSDDEEEEIKKIRRILDDLE